MRHSARCSIALFLALAAVCSAGSAADTGSYLAWLDREETLIARVVAACERSGGRNLGPLGEARRLARTPGGVPLRSTFWLDRLGQQVENAAAEDRLGRLREIQALLGEHRALASLPLGSLERGRPRERLRRILARREFAHQPAATGWQDRIWGRINHLIARIMTAFLRSGAAGYLLYILAALAVLAVAIFLIMALRTRSLAYRPAGIAAGGDERQADVERREADDLLRLAERAYQEERFRDGLRLLYLALLQELDRAGVIRLVKQKTNWEYRREIERNRAELAAYFTPLTDLYEAKWYGKEDCASGHYLAARRLCEGARGAAR